jgi:hypothetical protein
MPTRFHLDIDSVNTLGPGGSRSAALPNGTLNTNSPHNEYNSGLLNPSTSFDLVRLEFATLGQTARQSGRFAVMSSTSLAAQTISAGTWTFNSYASHSNNNAQAFYALSLYVYRPSTDSVVAYIYDSNAELGTRFTVSGGFINFTISGSEVTAAEGDVLVLEVWYTSAQSQSKSFAVASFFDPDEYIDAPQDILLVAKRRIFIVS